MPDAGAALRWTLDPSMDAPKRRERWNQIETQAFNQQLETQTGADVSAVDSGCARLQSDPGAARGVRKYLNSTGAAAARASAPGAFGVTPWFDRDTRYVAITRGIGAEHHGHPLRRRGLRGGTGEALQPLIQEALAR